MNEQDRLEASIAAAGSVPRVAQSPLGRRIEFSPDILSHAAQESWCQAQR